MNKNIKTTKAVKETNALKLPLWFWVISILGLLWFLMDLMAFVMRVFMFDAMMSDMPENQQRLYIAMPSWVNVIFSLEVFGGVLGCIGLLLKKRWALVFFIISIIGVLTQTYYVYFMSDAISLMGAPAIIMPLVAIFIGTGLIFTMKQATSRCWIK